MEPTPCAHADELAREIAETLEALRLVTRPETRCAAPCQHGQCARVRRAAAAIAKYEWRRHEYYVLRLDNGTGEAGR